MGKIKGKPTPVTSIRPETPRLQKYIQANGEVSPRRIHSPVGLTGQILNLHAF